MISVINANPKVLEIVIKAYELANINARSSPVRGGTDGSTLSLDYGIPTPNIFTGAFNFHSRTEYVIFSQMVAGVHVVSNLIQLWKDEN